MSDYLERTKQLIGEDNVKIIASKVILLVGLGGVGGTVFEALIRSGVKHIYVCDGDIVSESNLNRQVLFNKSSLGQKKVLLAKEYVKNIAKDIEIKTFDFFLDDTNINQLENTKFDAIIDAVDDCRAKILLTKLAQKQNTLFISSLGTGNKLDPTQLVVTTLDKTSNDPLAKKFRLLVRKEELDLSKINVVFSKESARVKNQTVSSMIFVPSTAGILMAQYILKQFIDV